MVNIPPIFKGDKVIVYTLPDCPNCVKLKDELDKRGIVYSVAQMDSVDSIVEMRSSDCFAMSAPVLQIGDKFYEEF
jgi:glutaredoxin